MAVWRCGGKAVRRHGRQGRGPLGVSSLESGVWTCRAAILALILALAAPALADTSVMLADGGMLDRVTLAPPAAPNQVSLQQPGASPVTVAIEDLLVVDFGKVPGRPVTPSVRFLNGDQVFGKVTFPAPRQ